MPLEPRSREQARQEMAFLDALDDIDRDRRERRGPSLNLFDPNQPLRMPVYVRLGNEVRLCVDQAEADRLLREYEIQQDIQRRQREEEFRYLYGRGPIWLDDMTYTNAAPPPPPPPGRPADAVRPPRASSIDWAAIDRQIREEERQRWEEEDRRRAEQQEERRRQEEERRVLAREIDNLPVAGRNCICDQCHNARVRERDRRRRHSFRPLLDTKDGFVVTCWLHSSTRLEGTCCEACGFEARKATEAAQNAMEVRARRVSRRVPTPANVPATTVEEQLDLWWEDPLF